MIFSKNIPKYFKRNLKEFILRSNNNNRTVVNKSIYFELDWVFYIPPIYDEPCEESEEICIGKSIY